VTEGFFPFVREFWSKLRVGASGFKSWIDASQRPLLKSRRHKVQSKFDCLSGGIRRI